MGTVHWSTVMFKDKQVSGNRQQCCDRLNLDSIGCNFRTNLTNTKLVWLDFDKPAGNN